MTHARNAHLERLTRPAAVIFPPLSMDEAAWDILLALHDDKGCALTLSKLALIVSIPAKSLGLWLGRLEERELIRGVLNEVTHELRAILTPAGRALLDRYFVATNELSGGRRPTSTQAEEWR